MITFRNLCVPDSQLSTFFRKARHDVNRDVVKVYVATNTLMQISLGHRPSLQQIVFAYGEIRMVIPSEERYKELLASFKEAMVNPIYSRASLD